MNRKKEIEKINKNIQDLVYEKIQLKKAYNYYHCIRDAEQYRHIEDNYGVGVPTSIGFTPLVKKHIDVLVGEYLDLDPDLQISCKDEKTIGNIMRDKKLQIDAALYNHLKKYLQNSIINVFFNNQQAINDPYIEQELLKIQENVNNTFVSEYEMAAQNILNYIKHSRDIDLKNKMRELFTDLLITGICYYRTKPTDAKNNMKLEILNPLDTFVERNRNEFFLNKSQRAIIRRWLTRYQIMEEFGDELTPEAINWLDDNIGKADRNWGTVYVRGVDNDSSVTPTRQSPSPGILGGLEVTPVFPWDATGMYNYQNMPVIAVYEVEWLEYNKDTDKTERHEGVKIGEDIYIVRGVSKNVVRSASNPKECSLSINGLFFLDKNGSPFSIVLATSDLQDKFDLLHYYRDNLIATSGTKGDWIDVAHLPTFLGVELPDRIQKFFAYKKNGGAFYDSSQEGAQMINTTFNGYDDTISSDSIQAIQMAIDAIEAQVASITGVFPEKLGGIQERDAVSNVKVGLRYSTLLTKQYFSAMDSIFKEVNYDLLNLAKIVYKKGFIGQMILGNKFNKVFTALPEHYTITDFDIHIQDSTETVQTMQDLKALNVELIKAGFADPEMIINILMSKNLTELKMYLERTMAAKKEENDQTMQLQQSVEQLEAARQQLEQQTQALQQQNEQLQKELEKNSAEQLELEKKRVSLEEKELRDKKDYNDKVIETKEKQIAVEHAQLYDNNPYNDKVKQNI